MRKALADTYSNENKFQLGKMDDAAEAFENTLKRIHYHLTKEQSDTCSYEYCLTHLLFSMCLIEQVKCDKCKFTLNIGEYSQLVYYINSTKLMLVLVFY
jgi:hypothetical protein